MRPIYVIAATSEDYMRYRQMCGFLTSECRYCPTIEHIKDLDRGVRVIVAGPNPPNAVVDYANMNGLFVTRAV